MLKLPAILHLEFPGNMNMYYTLQNFSKFGATVKRSCVYKPFLNIFNIWSKWFKRAENPRKIMEGEFIGNVQMKAFYFKCLQSFTKLRVAVKWNLVHLCYKLFITIYMYITYAQKSKFKKDQNSG